MDTKSISYIFGLHRKDNWLHIVNRAKLMMRTNYTHKQIKNAKTKFLWLMSAMHGFPISTLSASKKWLMTTLYLLGEAASKYKVITQLSSLNHILHIHFCFTYSQQLYCMECIVQPPEVVKTFMYIFHLKWGLARCFISPHNCISSNN